MRRTILLPLLLTAPAGAQEAADPKLLAESNAVRAVGNHAHVMAAAGVDGRADEEFDAIARGGLEFVSPPPLRLRPDNPIYTGAWRELYGYKHGEQNGRGARARAARSGAARDARAGRGRLYVLQAH